MTSGSHDSPIRDDIDALTRILVIAAAVPDEAKSAEATELAALLEDRMSEADVSLAMALADAELSISMGGGA